MKTTTYRTDVAFNAQVEGHYNSLWSARPDELAWFSCLGGSGLSVDLPDEIGIEEEVVRLPDFVAKLPDELVNQITDRFRQVNFTDEQIAQINFYREGTPSEPQWFDIEKPLRGSR